MHEWVSLVGAVPVSTKIKTAECRRRRQSARSAEHAHGLCVDFRNMVASGYSIPTLREIAPHEVELFTLSDDSDFAFSV